MKRCENCSEELRKRPKEAYWQFEERRFCSKSCHISTRNRKPDDELSESYRYRRRKLGDRRIDAHRLVVEEAIGRPLRPDEFVHHRNHNKLDNRIENLEIKSPVEHGRLHHLKYEISKICVVCGSQFTPHKTKRKRNQTCGHKTCVGELIRRVRWSLSRLPEHGDSSGESSALSGDAA